LTSIEVDALNPAYSSFDGVLLNKTGTVFIRCPEGARSVTIGNSVTSIGNEAFLDCTGLSSITIPNSVTSIGDGAFEGCTGLISITIPNSVTSIGGWAFYGCTGLSSVTIPNSVTNIDWGTFSGCTGLTEACFEGNAPVSLGGNAFESCPAVIVYYRAGTTGWGSIFDGRPTALWIPITPSVPSISANHPLKLLTHSPAPASVRVQHSANLVDWEDWQTVSRDAGPSELQDAEASTAPYRFYRGIEE
jgi:hypothetical protein